MSVILQERDYRILRLGYEHQFLLTEHVERYFAGAGYRAACKRVQKLCEAGYLRQEPGAELGRRPIFRVTQSGAGAALQSGARLVPQVRRLQLVTLTHDSIVLSARQRLEELWDASFVCEGAIKGREYRQIPDGLFFFPSGKGIALEVENSDKGRARFVRLLQRWKDVPQIVFVLYLATSRELFETIKKYLPAGPQDRPMGVVLWNELASSRPVVWTRRGDVSLFDRRTY